MIGKVAAGALLAAGMVLAPVAADATPAPRYVIAYWTINTPDFQAGGDVWGGGGQTLAGFALTDSKDLTQLQGLVPCGAWYQADLYANDQVTAALLADGVGKARLYGPSNPKESPAPGVSPWYITSWFSGECAEKPVVRPFHDERQEVTCDAVTTFTRDGFFDLDFDPVANVWSERAEPTVTAEASSVAPNTAPDASCVPTPVPTPPVDVQLPTLAETGMSPGASWLLVGSLLALCMGGAGVAMRSVLRRRS